MFIDARFYDAILHDQRFLDAAQLPGGEPEPADEEAPPTERCPVPEFR